jgi:hypothetical protein
LDAAHVSLSMMSTHRRNNSCPGSTADVLALDPTPGGAV